MHVYVYVRKCVCMYACSCVSVCVHTSVCMQTHITDGRGCLTVSLDRVCMKNNVNNLIQFRTSNHSVTGKVFSADVQLLGDCD